MLDITRDKRGFLCVHQTTHTFHATYHKFWYYDTEHWLASTHGELHDTPERVMTAEDIAWVKQHYLTKLSTPPVSAPKVGDRVVTRDGLLGTILSIGERGIRDGRPWSTDRVEVQCERLQATHAVNPRWYFPDDLTVVTS